MLQGSRLRKSSTIVSWLLGANKNPIALGGTQQEEILAVVLRYVVIGDHSRNETILPPPSFHVLFELVLKFHHSS